MITKDLLDQIVAVLLPEMGDANARKALIESALYGSLLLQKIQWDGPARPFTMRLVRELDQFGEIEPGRLALVALLEEAKAVVGTNHQTEIEGLLTKLKSPPARQEIQPPPRIFAEGELYVFISYARLDQAVAEKVDAFLTAAGVRVFRDNQIPPGANWDLAIDKALQKCQRMVLLLSASSMPERKEVHREWFFFDQQRKPIYPLYIQDCTLHTRLVAYNYIDARSDLQGALERILDDLKRDFVPTPPAKRGEKDSVVEVLEKESEQDILTKYRRERIAEWSQPRYALEKRFVNLTLLIDKGEQELERWQRDENFRFDDLRDVLARTLDDRALVLLGAPGSGKSTLLRRLQLDHSEDRLRDGADEISFFIPLNNYNGEQLPREWLLSAWRERYPRLPPLESWLQQGRALLLLDALNEMQPRAGLTYDLLLGRWREFVQQAERLGNRLVFSCRKLDYSAGLSSKDLPVPQVQVQPLNDQQVREFLRAYAPAQELRIWAELEKDARQLELFKTPYFLRLLCEQVETAGEVPKGRAGLFTGFVRKMLARAADGPLFQPGALLDERDRRKLSLRDWPDSFALPERGLLIPQLSALAFSMQHKRSANENAQLRLSFDDACALLAPPHAEDLLKAGQALSVLDEDTAKDEILFFHQLLQEYFAARRLAKEPKPELIHVEWATDQVRPTLEETLAGLADGEPLPPLAQTGWEETTLTAAPMAKDPQTFIRDLIQENLPLAARCAASPEVKIGAELKREIQRELIARTKDMKADLRARIAAGEALGTIGDPRFERRQGPHGDYLLPPLAEISGGTYPIGDDKGNYDDEKPADKVELAPFQIGKFPVTNAEYAMFIAARGYEDEQWWDTTEALAWLREGGGEGSRQSWRDHRKNLQKWTDDGIHDLVKQNRITSKQAEDWITIRNWTDEHFEQQLDEWYPSGKLYRQPEYWDDTRFNNPAQPVVGVTWFEARAYCNWLTANAGGEERIFRLPTEAEFEAAARGKKGRMFPYGKTFDKGRSNTFESHIRRTTPVGIFENATPEGAFDLSGNAYTWTLSIYDQDKFPYPYRSDDNREDIHQEGVKRVLRGGAWNVNQDYARAVYRLNNNPYNRNDIAGFRVVGVVRPPSL